MISESRIPVICLDGPGGSGKSTVAKRLAHALAWHRLDSGALYRLVAAAALDRHVDLKDSRAVAALAADWGLSGDGARAAHPNEAQSHRIRSEPVSRAASTIAVYPELRAAMLARQRAARRPPGLVADGRDMGTVVFPDAPLKVFLDATPEERAKRRTKQLKNKGLNVSFRDLLAGIQERDARDRERAAAPLKPADDAIVIDSTALGLDDVVEMALSLALERGLEASAGARKLNQRACKPTP